MARALDANDVAEAIAPTPLVDRALDLLGAAGWPADTAICVMTGDNATLTAFLVHRAGGDWTIDALQSPIDVEPLSRRLSRGTTSGRGPFAPRSCGGPAAVSEI